MKDDKVFPVIMLDSHGEILEFESKKDAEQMANILNTNSDSGHRYEVNIV